MRNPIRQQPRRVRAQPAQDPNVSGGRWFATQVIRLRDGLPVEAHQRLAQAVCASLFGPIASGPALGPVVARKGGDAASLGAPAELHGPGGLHSLR
jgi:hypothetical protein